MEKIFPVTDYRKDIDGLRAIAVLSVILFHFGYLSRGYLGVDIFFVISGYLITNILYRELQQDRFSLSGFYLRRVRRIIPLVLVTSLTALIIGLFVMLPDDLENLAQSVVATNLFANNILLWLTTGNYWAIANEYKPLMHTWSLGVEEQYYLLYPLLFLFLSGIRKRLLFPALVILTIISLLLFFWSEDSSAKFYLISYRFFELALGGLGAILLGGKMLNRWVKHFFLVILLILMIVKTSLPSGIILIVIVISSLGILVSDNDKISSIMLENKLMTGIGKISFSLYMWHQVVLAYMRYVFVWEYTQLQAALAFVIIVLLSVVTYFLVEQPFRNRRKVSTRQLLVTCSAIAVLSTSFSIYLYSINGVVRDVPELDIFQEKQDVKIMRSGETNITYNSRIYELNKAFTADDKIKILLIGDSFARDWANILLASDFADRIEVSYTTSIENTVDINERFSQAKYIFFSEITKADLVTTAQKFHFDTSKVWNVGTKNFGEHNGLFYQKRKEATYCKQRTDMTDGYLEKNNKLKKQWGAKYIDLIGMIIDEDGKVPVFTQECKFISQDGHHLTTNGAVYFASLLDLHKIFHPK